MTLAFPTGEPFTIGVVGYEYRPATSHETTPRLVPEVEIEGILAETVVDTGGFYQFCHPELACRLSLTPTEALTGSQTILLTPGTRPADSCVRPGSPRLPMRALIIPWVTMNSGPTIG
jgi:hypothetical protein